MPTFPHKYVGRPGDVWPSLAPAIPAREATKSTPAAHAGVPVVGEVYDLHVDPDRPDAWEPVDGHDEKLPAKKADLQKLAAELGLDDTGTVAELTARIEAHQATAAQDTEDDTASANDADPAEHTEA